jgi:hypothetical protein
MGFSSPSCGGGHETKLDRWLNELHFRSCEEVKSAQGAGSMCFDEKEERVEDSPAG